MSSRIFPAALAVNVAFFPVVTHGLETLVGLITPKAFIGDLRTLSGNGWELTKYETEDGRWAARLTTGGQIVHTFEPTNFEDWIRFQIWPVEGGPERLLIVFRFMGGAHGSRTIDIIDLKNEFRIVMAGPEQFNFVDGIVDLDSDGWPEVLGRSTAFDYLDFPILNSHADGVAPLVVMSYDDETGRYRCMNHRFPGLYESDLQVIETEFKTLNEDGSRIPADVVLPENLERRAELRALIRWVVNLCYAGDETRAFEVLETYTDDVLYTFLARTIRRHLAEDANYRQLREAVTTAEH